ncbi:CMP-N-acetylneuraminate-beta-galactosamide-alpha-2,3-sialyltransferase 1-like [Girardinichthys multiradiatus]|uniref:CMP-N-acetylneuraminate-beta-galactosamide- alpha-2,3-sialyltransferase 1-like n=1 Tax=Girardinichthys multiradiatus TaxID=208333 RepID=UPI001FADBB23|nr:CMP-N-acetylneuraminate-beta-galactosamide-alpha-2,3-sialyltransferase 1-like [Girardinichthys multiradiatus]
MGPSPWKSTQFHSKECSGDIWEFANNTLSSAGGSVVRSRMSSRLKLLVFILSVAAYGLLLMVVFTDQFNLQGQTSCACKKCLSDDNLLLSHLNRSDELFLSAKTNISEEAFNWWKGLQCEKQDYRFFKKTVNKLFEIFPPSPNLQKPSPDSCRTCAVVGNSVNLKRSHYGPLIDYQDIVIRMNSATTKGYEEDIGTKTTHHVMYPESAVDLQNSTHLVLFPFKIMDLQWLIKAFTTRFYGKSYAPIKTNIRANKDLVMVVNPAFMKYSHETWLEKKGAYPSTGFMTLIFALHICDEVHVFGFGADSDGNWSHYFEELKDKNLKTGQHPGHLEYDIIQQLAKEKTINFYKGS